MNDSNPNNLLTWIKRFGGFITAMVGVLSGIIALIQATRKDWGVFFTISLGACYLLVGGSLFYIWVRKRSVRLEGNSIPQEQFFYGKGKRRLAIVALVIWLLLGLGIGGGYILSQFPITPENSDKDEFVILVADFDGPDKTYGITETILSSLRTATENYEDTEIIALEEKITTREGSKVTRAKAKEQGADILLWGWYRVPQDTTLVTIHFEMLKELTIPVLRENEQSERVATSDLESFQFQLRVSTEMDYLTLMTLGIVRYETDDFDGAIERFSAALDQSDVPQKIGVPKPVIYFLRGMAYLENKANDKAIADFDRVIESNDLNPDVLNILFFVRGDANLNKQAYSQAIADYDRVIELDPNSAITYQKRGIAYMMKREFEPALKNFDRAIELDPESEYNYMARKYILQEDSTLRQSDTSLNNVRQNE